MSGAKRIIYQVLTVRYLDCESANLASINPDQLCNDCLAGAKQTCAAPLPGPLIAQI
ncbi:hypothetical protein BDR04DRAFT_1149512 [Suillus decipiens]|nr:hypothetical protein BDR04DRAFT_1149512 [Suillus decipiens]